MVGLTPVEAGFHPSFIPNSWYNIALEFVAAEAYLSMPGSKKLKQPSHQKTGDVQQAGGLSAELNLSAQLLDNATDSINVIDLEGNVVYVNERACKSLGYSRDELIGMNIHKLVSPEHAVFIETRVKEVMEKGESTFETAQIRKDGSLVPLELHARVIEYGGRNLILDVGRDITERKKLEEELRLESLLLDSTIDSIFLRDVDEKIIYANKASYETRGYSKEEFLNLKVHEFLDPDDIKSLEQRTQAILERGRSVFQVTHIRKDGSKMPVEIDADVITLGDRRLILTVVRDITERKKAEEELKLKSEILDNATDFIFLRNPDGKIVYTNKMASESHGYSKEEIMGMNVRQLLLPEEARIVEPRTQELLKKGKLAFESVHVRKDGSTITMEVHSRVIEAVGEQFILSVCRNISERKRLEEEIRLKAQLLDGATDIIYLRDLDGNYLYMNETASKYLGYTREELLTMTIQQLVPHGYPTASGLLQPELDQKGEAAFETYLIRKDGSLMPVEVHARLIESGGKKLIFGISRDITERKKMEEIIKQLAYHDTLTGLPNRALFADRFNLALAHAIRYQHKLALLMMDLDKFKEVNDTLGHEAGDALLKEVGSRLSGLVRKIDTVSRMGGDEFVLLLTEVHQVEAANSVAQKIVDAIKQPFVIDGHERSVTTSIGIALYPDEGKDIDTLLKHADDAMYQVKNRGRNGYLRYTPPITP